MVVSQKFGKFMVRFSVDNLTDSEYLFTQGPETQRVYKFGRTYQVSVGLNVY
jgi:outer membrane receptor protein involved in Fe transport